VKLWFESEGEYVFGYGIALILEAIERLGSIRAATDELGQSYRYIWGRIKTCEKRLGRPLVESTVGGADRHRSRLTPLGRQLTTSFLALRTELLDIADKRFRHFPR
jgi:molybdate transport system regulatory protein